MATELVKDQAPLADVVMCCTSIPPEARHIIAAAAEEMGATHKFDLTSDVTHLIVGDIDTPKYKYVAKERPDVKVVLPSFVDAVRKVWIGGSDVDLAPLEVEHRVPTFFGLKVCLTGFENPSTRDNIKQTILGNGGEFHGDLTRAVTHLIAAAPDGKKYEHSRRWNIRIVGFEWLQDCLERGMVLDESLYDPILAPQDRGKDAYNKAAMEHVTLGKRPRDEEKPAEPAARRKLRRTMSKKMESQQETIWADITSAGSGQATGAPLEPLEVERTSDAVQQKDGSAHPTPDPAIEPTRRKSAAPAALEKVQKPILRGEETLQGVAVYIHGFTDTKVDILRGYLEGHGACVYSSAAKLTAEMDPILGGYVVIPFDIPLAELPPIPAPAANLQQVTEWWVESCMMHKRLIDPDTYPLCKPFNQHSVEVALIECDIGVKNFTIASTGFVNMDLLHVTKAVAFMGATYSEYLKPGVNLLICNSSSFNKEKLDFAIENHIEAVSEHWLYESVDSGAMQDPQEFAMKTETPTVPVDYAPTKAKTGGSKPSLKSRMLPLEFQAPSVEARPKAAKLGGNIRDLKSAAKSNKGPFFEDEDEADAKPMVKPRQAREPNTRPSLRELSQEQQNSPRKASQPSQNPLPGNGKYQHALNLNENTNTTSTVDQPLNAATTAAADTSQQTEVLNNAIASLLERKQAADARRSVSEQSTKIDSLGKRIRGPLGRALSGGSFGSNLSRRASSVGSNVSQDEQRSAAVLPDPSQKIIYEDEKAQEERRALIKKMGGQVDMDEEGRKRVESIGTVKDAAVAGASGLAGGRTRRKAAKK